MYADLINPVDEFGHDGFSYTAQGVFDLRADLGKYLVSNSLPMHQLPKSGLVQLY